MKSEPTFQTEESKFRILKGHILKKYGEIVTDDNCSLLSVQSSTLDLHQSQKKIERLLDDIFSVKKEENFSERLRVQLSGIKDQYLQDIQNSKLGQIQNHAKLYVSFTDAFIEAMQEYGGDTHINKHGLNYHLYLEDGNEISWIVDDVKDILDTALSTKNKEIIRIVGHLPISITRLAIKNYDHYIFNEFIRFILYFYHNTLNFEDEDVRKFMIKRCWLHLRETAEYFVRPQLGRNDLKEVHILELKDFAVAILIIFQGLIKRAYDHRKTRRFCTFCRKNKLFI